MEQADWRRYRLHLIICRRTIPFGFRRYQVWKEGRLLGTFRDGVNAELHIDSILGRESR